MTELLDEPMMQARFDAVANTVDDSDWSQVVRALHAVKTELRPTSQAGQRGLVGRSRRPRLRYALAAALVLAAALGTAVAFGWPQDFINFLTAPSAPKKVSNSFGMQNVSAPPGMNPQAIPGQARRIMAARFDGTGIHPGHGGWHVLYVAPTRKRGFCYEWTKFVGGCFDPTAKPTDPNAAAYARTVGPLGVGWMGNEFPMVITGYVRSGSAQSVEARFANGGSAAIPVTWVSAPINAGFFIYVVPSEHKSLATAVSAIVALNSSGDVIGTERFRVGSPLDRMVARTLPDGTHVPLSARAEIATARKVISLRASNGSAVWLWVMDRRGGGTCYAFNQGSGCPPPAAINRGPAFAGGLSIGGKRVLFFAQARNSVSAIELRYQGGTVERLAPTAGFVLHEIVPAHYTRGTRLVSATGVGADGRVLFRQNFRPLTPGVYPCAKPIARGYGVKTCP